jgi:hypothetical protein
VRQQLEPFGFEKSRLWDAIMDNLRAAIEVEVAAAVSSDTKGEDRTHQCGRSEGLLEFKEHIESLREMALSKLN